MSIEERQCSEFPSSVRDQGIAVLSYVFPSTPVRGFFGSLFCLVCFEEGVCESIFVFYLPGLCLATEKNAGPEKTADRAAPVNLCIKINIYFSLRAETFSCAYVRVHGRVGYE